MTDPTTILRLWFYASALWVLVMAAPLTAAYNVYWSERIAFESLRRSIEQTGTLATRRQDGFPDMAWKFDGEEATFQIRIETARDQVESTIIAAASIPASLFAFAMFLIWWTRRK